MSTAPLNSLRPRAATSLALRRAPLILVVVLLLTALVSCGGSDDESASQTTPVPTTEPVPTSTPTSEPATTPTSPPPTATTAPTATTEPTAAPTTTPTSPPPTATTPPSTPSPTATTVPTATTTPTTTAVPTAAPTATSTPTATPIGGVITAGIGELFLVTFEIDGTSSFRWEIGEMPGGSLLEVVDEIYIGPYGGTTGTSAWQHFTLRGLNDGQATLNFWLTDGSAPMDRAQFQVVIGSGSPPCSGIYKVAIGERFEIVLQSNSTTGFRWELRDIPNPGVVKLISDHYIAATSSAPGASGWQRFVFEGAVDGETDLDFWYVRPFDDPPAPANTANFKAIVGTGIPGCSGVFDIVPGEDFEIALESNPTTGYRWELAEAPAPGVVLLIKEEFLAPTSSLVGAPGTQVFTFRGMKVGETPLKFWYVRPFDDPPVATNRINFMVIVK